jgi:putative hydrolase of the HAD superfamily
MIGNSLNIILPFWLSEDMQSNSFHTTWAHERIDHKIEHENFRAYEKLTMF